MKRLIFFLFLFLVGAALQGGIGFFPTFLVRFDLFLLLVIYAGLTTPLFPGGIGLLFLALAMEVIVAPQAGTLSLTYLFIFLILRMAHGRFFLDGAAAKWLWTFLLSLLHKAVIALLLQQPLLLWSLVDSLLNASLAVPVYSGIAFLERRLASRIDSHA